uniref:EF-hand domain-containing protein n=1 Tax=Alexandrium monilatum TaxID=311494 RepID=A0A7S4RJD8_9DINO
MGRQHPENTLALFDDRPTMGPRTAQQIYLQDHMQRVHNEIESTTRKLELEKRRLNKLEEEVERVRAEHEEKAAKASNSKATSGMSIKKLEHRLEKAIATLNASLHENESIREKIDSTRRERLQMNQVFKKLQNDIKENQSQVMQLQRESDQARQEEEERQHRMAALRKQLDRERRHFKGTVQKLQKDMKDREREDLIQRVAMVRESFDKTDDERKNKNRSLKADEEENFNSTAVMRRILKHAFLNAIQRRHIRQHQKNIEVFEQAFATIKSTTGISDIEEIVKIFVILEQRNFSLLTYVNALNSDIESLDKQNRELEHQLDTQKKLEDESDKKRDGVLTDLIQQIESTSRMTEENNLQAKQNVEVLECCKPLVQAILKTVEKENKGFGGQPAPEFTGENVLAWLTYVEKTLTQWKDFLPDTKDTRQFKGPSKVYRFTAGQYVHQLQPKKHQTVPTSLVKAGELPSAANAFLEAGAMPKGALAKNEDDSSDEEDDLMSHPWNRQELRDRAVAAVAKRKKHRKTDAPGQQASQGPGPEQTSKPDADSGGAGGAGAGGAAGKADGMEPPSSADLMNYDDLIEKKDGEEDSLGSDDSDLDDDIGPTDEEINEIFLKRYKMSKEELQAMADKMGIQLNNLCYLKQEFDAYDEDRSGYIDVKELKGLLEKLGEELSDDELEQAFRELDSDGSGEIEFFEFVEWFTSED